MQTISIFHLTTSQGCRLAIAFRVQFRGELH